MPRSNCSLAKTRKDAIKIINKMYEKDDYSSVDQLVKLKVKYADNLNVVNWVNKRLGDLKK
jgi:hypothetical protein